MIFDIRRQHILTSHPEKPFLLFYSNVQHAETEKKDCNRTKMFYLEKNSLCNDRWWDEVKGSKVIFRHKHSNDNCVISSPLDQKGWCIYDWSNLYKPLISHSLAQLQSKFTVMSNQYQNGSLYMSCLEIMHIYMWCSDLIWWILHWQELITYIITGIGYRTNVTNLHWILLTDLLKQYTVITSV